MNRQDAKVAKGEELEEPSTELDQLAHRVIGAAIEVHRVLGPGLLESVYEEALCVELAQRGMGFTRQVPVGVLAQVLSYLKATELRLALLITFNVTVLRRGIRRLIHTP